jgi:predicted PurR-regulated permease PerM
MSDKKAAWKADLGVFIFLALFFLVVYAIGQAVTPFVLAALLGYMLNPAVNAMARRGVPRAAAALLFALLIFLVIGGLISAVILVSMREVPQLVNNFPGYVETFRTVYFPAIRDFLGLGPEVNLDQLSAELHDKLVHLSPESFASAAGSALSVLTGTVNVLMTLLSVFLIPVLMVYILVDFEKMKDAVLDVLPKGYKDAIVIKLAEVESVLRDFVKGQLTVALIMGVLYCIGLWAAGVDMPILVGMSAGILNLVPYLGTSIGCIVSVALVLLKYHDLLHPGIVLAVFGAVQTLEGYLITPRVIGGKLGLHPLVILLAIVVFGHLLGFAGILLAVPFAAVLKVFIAGFIRDYKASRLYEGGE